MATGGQNGDPGCAKVPFPGEKGIHLGSLWAPYLVKVGDVRGIGLFLAMELVSDRQTKAGFDADVEIGVRLTEKFKSKGLIFRARENILHFGPPLCITREEVDEIVSGIPLNAMRGKLREVICDEAFKHLKRGGSFVQVSYLPRCPVPKNIIAKHAGKRIFCGITLRNIPPAFVWRIKKT